MSHVHAHDTIVTCHYSKFVGTFTHWAIYRDDEDYRLSISAKNCWYLREFLSTLQDDTPNSPEQMSHDTWCWTLFNESKDVLEQHVVALENLCKDDGYMRLERVPVENV